MSRFVKGTGDEKPCEGRRIKGGISKIKIKYN